MINNPASPVTVKTWPNLELHLALDRDCSFSDADWPVDANGVKKPVAWGKSSTTSHYIAPKTGAPHLIPHYAGVPVVAWDNSWASPDEAHWDVVRAAVFGTTGVESAEKPAWSRIRHLIGLHQDESLTQKTPYNETDMGWLQRHFTYTHGGQPHVGWYHGTAFRSGSNGYDNNHYQRIFWMLVEMLLEKDTAHRDTVLWPYFVEQSIAHLALGRFWGGPDKGAARDEKGTHLVGDSNRVPVSKQWVMDLGAGYLMFKGHPAFEEAIRNCADWWFRRGADKAWQGYWGVRQASHHIEDLVNIALMIPDLRVDCVKHIKDMLHNLDRFLDRDHYVWLNLGNGGAAEESPWMASQAVSACFRSWELLPETQGFGPTKDDLLNVMKEMFTDKGSELIAGFRVLRYRYHTTTHPARYIVNTSWAVPALRHLVNHDPVWAAKQYKETKTLIQEYAGASIAELWAGNPPAPKDMGFRFPPQGGAWPKSLLAAIEAIR